MKKLAPLLICVLTLSGSPAKACHIYKYWAYKFPQSCGARVAHAQIFAHFRRQRLAIQLPPKPEPAVALPSLTKGEIGFGEADEPTRARVLLRAALEAANGH